MGITNWKTWATNDVLTSSDMDTYLRDNGRWLSGNATGGKPHCRVTDSAGGAISSGGVVTFDTERFDPQAMHSTSANTGRITIPSGGGGIYHVGAHLRLSAVSSAANAQTVVGLLVNGTTTIANQEGSWMEAALTRTHYISLSTFWSFAAADYVQVVVSFTNMTSMTVAQADSYSPEFWAYWVSE